MEGWLGEEGTKIRLEQLKSGHASWRSRRSRTVKDWEGAYVLAHSLSHALMTEIALDCGYPASALKERIYALPGPGLGSAPRTGILLYTATAGTQGTLGGLVEVATRFPQVLRSALDRLQLCSSEGRVPGRGVGAVGKSPAGATAESLA